MVGQSVWHGQGGDDGENAMNMCRMTAVVSEREARGNFANEEYGEYKLQTARPEREGEREQMREGRSEKKPSRGRRFAAANGGRMETQVTIEK